jgi:hypothetical protein
MTLEISSMLILLIGFGMGLLYKCKVININNKCNQKFED